MTITDTLTQLGTKVETPASPETAMLETVPYDRVGGPPAIVRFTCPNSPRCARSPASLTSPTSSSTTRPTNSWSNPSR